MRRNQTLSVWNYLWQLHYQSKRILKIQTKQATTAEINTEEVKTKRDQRPSYRPIQFFGLLLGPFLFALCMLFFHPEGLSNEGRGVLACTLWIASWWITEAIPIPATSLLPLIIFPLTGSLEMGITTSGYSDPIIFLFMGGFILALSMERWGLHKRIALEIISLIGTRSDRIVLGFMIATGFLSMWISNSATAMMMMPIGMAIIFQFSEALKDNKEVDTRPQHFNFGKALMLGIAYSASIGGLATLIGTPPNALFAGAVNTLYGLEISFGGWMLFGLPVSALLIGLCWWYLVKVAFPMKLKSVPGGKSVIESEKKALGKISREESIVLVIFSLTAITWILRSFVLKGLNLNDTNIGIFAAILLFIIPAPNYQGQFIMNWDAAKKLPWGVLLLFGSGLTIAAGFKETGLALWIGEQLTVLGGVSLFIIILATAGLIIFLTEITSNTATGAMMFPVMGGLALSLGVHPFGLMVAAGLAASCAFMLPVATPPNAVVFGSGYLKMEDMAKTGFWLNLMGMVIISLFVYFFLPLVWGIDLGNFPFN
ncbi:SLC13 family permease [Xanthovirga aplysinae]|uniref:SLC13 family permease n=1 Tax=Xanthovirga aplysinae TaxID=2529853 RepID=UPI0012BC7420|nr:DASS family sodium-coupled anion symporter [Xanthovirga aplysinae]MTI32519.1 DASS family sodium-coupled anion symporter [Xanthovirga aplysinae]